MSKSCRSVSLSLSLYTSLSLSPCCWQAKSLKVSNDNERSTNFVFFVVHLLLFLLLLSMLFVLLLLRRAQNFNWNLQFNFCIKQEDIGGEREPEKGRGTGIGRTLRLFSMRIATPHSMKAEQTPDETHKNILNKKKLNRYADFASIIIVAINVFF